MIRCERLRDLTYKANAVNLPLLNMYDDTPYVDFPSNPWLYYRLVSLKLNPSLLLQGIVNKARPERATVTTDPAGVGKACKAFGSVLARALLLMVHNPAGPGRNIQEKHTQSEKRGDRTGNETVER